jgi:pimeloyl-ACP methyl ester carboxylesterase
MGDKDPLESPLLDFTEIDPHNTIWHTAVAKNLKTDLLSNFDKMIINLPNEFGETPLIMCAKHKNIEMATFLIEFGADLDLSDENGSTALHIAVSQNHYEFVHLLIQSGCNTHILDNKGLTPFEICEESKNAKMMSYFRTEIAIEKKTESFWNRLKYSFSFPAEKQRRILEFIKSHKIPLESHETTTQDGYILQILRLVRKNAPVVFLQHGLFNSSSVWCTCGKSSLGFQLWEQGYDVWMGNNRGTQFSRKHVDFHDGMDEYWIWSWSQLAQFDFPAQLKYVLSKSGQKKLSYVGHSQGTTQAFAGLCLDKDLQKSIDLFVGFAPAISLQYQSSQTYKVISGLQTDKILSTFSIMFHHEVAPTFLSRTILPQLARSLGHLDSAWSFAWDCDLETIHLDLLTVTEPSPTSFTNLMHWSQLMRAKKFVAFDFGSEINVKKYGSREPLEYDIYKI